MAFDPKMPLGLPGPLTDSLSVEWDFPDPVVGKAGGKQPLVCIILPRRNRPKP